MTDLRPVPDPHRSYKVVLIATGKLHERTFPTLTEAEVHARDLRAGSVGTVELWEGYRDRNWQLLRTTTLTRTGAAPGRTAAATRSASYWRAEVARLRARK